MSQRKRPRDLRAGLADIYAAKTPAKKETTAAEDTGTPAETPPDAGSDERQIGRVGGAPAVLVEQQRQGLMRENAELRAALDRMRTDYENGAFVWRSPTFTQEGEAIKNAIETFVQDGNIQAALDKAAAEIDQARGQ